MRRVLIALAMIAASVFMAAPAIAQDDSSDSNEPATSNESSSQATKPPPAEDPPTPEDARQSPPAAETPGTQSPDAEPEAEAEASTTEGEFEIMAVVDQVTICHARASQTNQYGPQASTVSVNSIFRPNGHGTHTGPVFPDADWGDIIPPFQHEGGSYPGMNWTPEGQAIFFNNCQVSDEPPPPPGENNVPICHATGSQNMPYSTPNPSVDGILNGHADHTGPVFSLGAEEWGDIIPPFDFGPGAQFDGLNWDADGQAIYFDDCNVTVDDDDDDGDDGDEDGNEDGDEDGNDDKAALPDAGGPSPWILLTGALLSVLGIAILSSNGSMSRAYGPVAGRHVRL